MVEGWPLPATGHDIAGTAGIVATFAAVDTVLVFFAV
jgi:hypothetical protein